MPLTIKTGHKRLIAPFYPSLHEKDEGRFDKKKASLNIKPTYHWKGSRSLLQSVDKQCSSFSTLILFFRFERV